MKKSDANLTQAMGVTYEEGFFLVRKLFWKRIFTSIKFANLKDNSKVLDIGCDAGQLLRTLRKFNAVCECWGIDIELKKEPLEIKNCNFKVADAKNLPFENNFFSVVFATDTLEHIRDVDKAINEINRALSHDGIFILCGPTESFFYKLGRLLLFGTYSKNVDLQKHGFRGEIDHHFHTIYELEKKVESNGFTKIKQKSLPGFPFPTLFRITKYKKTN